MSKQFVRQLASLLPFSTVILLILGQSLLGARTDGFHTHFLSAASGTSNVFAFTSNTDAPAPTAELSPWAYRRAITIDNSANPTDLVNYQVKLTLNTSNFDFSRPQPTGLDLRFADSDGSTLLDHWTESYDSATQAATIWVKVPIIPASSNKIVYLYYGNPSATSTSSGNNTFDFFDDFDHENPILKFGFITDIHHTLYPGNEINVGDNTPRMQAFGSAMNQENVDFVIDGGDSVDNLDSSGTVLTTTSFLNNLDSYMQGITTFQGKIYHTLGNHDMQVVDKSDVIARLNQPTLNSFMPAGYYYFDYPEQELRLVVLDGQYNTDGTDRRPGDNLYARGYIPPAEQTWLSNTLSDARAYGYKVIVIHHQKLTDTFSWGTSNSDEVTTIIENSGVVFLVLQGHSHENSLLVRNGVTYISNYSPIGHKGDTTPDDWAVIRVYSNGRFTLTGSGYVTSQAGGMDTLLPSWTIDSGTLLEENGYLRMTGAPTIMHTKTYVDQDNTIVDAKVTKWAGSSPSSEVRVLRQFADATSYTQLNSKWDADAFAVTQIISSTSTTIISSSYYKLTDSKWETVQFAWSASTLKAKVGASAWRSATLPFTNNRYIGLRAKGTDLRIDYILVRRYAPVEPPAAVGVEET